MHHNGNTKKHNYMYRKERNAVKRERQGVVHILLNYKCKSNLGTKFFEI